MGRRAKSFRAGIDVLRAWHLSSLMTFKRALAGASMLLLGLVATYLLNPAETASLDPRARLLGFLLYSVPSASNAPTLDAGDVVWVNTFAYAFSKVSRKDMIAFIPDHDPRIYVKRAIALESDVVKEKFIVHRIGLESIELRFVGFPDTESEQLEIGTK